MMLWLSKGMAGKSCHIGRSRMLRTALETCLWWMKLKDTSPRKSIQETIDTVSGFHLVSRKCSAQSDMKTPDSLQKPMVDYFSMGFHISNTTQSKLWMITIWLVVWNMLYFPTYWEFHHPNWRTHMFQRGFSPGPPTRNPWTEIRSQPKQLAPCDLRSSS